MKAPSRLAAPSHCMDIMKRVARFTRSISPCSRSATGAGWHGKTTTGRVSSVEGASFSGQCMTCKKDKVWRCPSDANLPDLRPPRREALRGLSANRRTLHLHDQDQGGARLMSTPHFPELITDSDTCGYSRDDCSITYRDFDMPTTGRSYIIVGCPDCGYIERIEPLRQIPSHGRKLTKLLKVMV